MWMLSFWRWLCGYVTFRAQGGLCERFLNLTDEYGLLLWNIVRKDDGLTANCRVIDYPRLRPVARRTGTRVRTVKKHGFQFMAKPLRRRPGLLIGTALALAVYFVLASRIWVIDINVPDDTLRTRIAHHLYEHGVFLGCDAKKIDIPSIRMSAIGELKEINQLSLYFDGSIAHVDVQLQEKTLSPPDTTPCHLIAARDGLILSMTVTGGDAIAKVGEGVVAGDMLVCGATETDKGVMLRHSNAVVMAKTTHQFEQTVHKTELLPQGGRVIHQPSLRLFSLCVPLYTDTVFDETWTVNATEHAAQLFGVSLPIGISETVFTHQDQVPITYTADQAEALARERLSADAQAQLDGIEIVDTHYSGVWEGERYHLTATYTCIENIAVPAPLLIDKPDDRKD